MKKAQKVCPFLSKNEPVSTTVVSPRYTVITADCVEDRCGIWSIERSQCGMIVPENNKTQNEKVKNV
jgi:hypothetical protein